MAGQAPPQPTWLDPWREATVALGVVKKAKIKSPDGKESEREIFAVIGTGVIFGSPEEQSRTPLLVTAKHVFFDPKEGWDPELIRLRFAWFEDRPVEDYLGIPIRLKEKGRHLWTPHPNPSVDLATIPLLITRDVAGRDSVSPVPVTHFVGAADIYEGAHVIVLGYPGAIGPAFWTRALVRSGVIAWVNPKNPAGEQIIIDSLVFPGNSGGPVFRLPTGVNRAGGYSIGTGVAFLGIVSQGRKQEMPLVAEGSRIEIQGPQGPVSVVSQQWIGVGIIEPAERVLELLKAALKSLP